MTVNNSMQENMNKKNFYLRIDKGEYLNVSLEDVNNPKPTKHSYKIYYSNSPVSLWYMYENINNTGIVSLQNSCAFYSAFDIEYKGTIALSYNSNDWKLTDGLSQCCLTIHDDTIVHPINKKEILHCC